MYRAVRGVRRQRELLVTTKTAYRCAVCAARAKTVDLGTVVQMLPCPIHPAAALIPEPPPDAVLELIERLRGPDPDLDVVRKHLAKVRLADADRAEVYAHGYTMALDDFEAAYRREAGIG